MRGSGDSEYVQKPFVKEEGRRFARHVRGHKFLYSMLVSIVKSLVAGQRIEDCDLSDIRAELYGLTPDRLGGLN